MNERENTFGLEHGEYESIEQERQEDAATDGVKTAEWLKTKHEEEKDRVFKNGIVGIEMHKFGDISREMRGLQYGITLIVAKSHVGKSTMLISMMNDILITSCKTQKLVKNVLYTCDDSVDYMRKMLVSNLSGVHKWKVDGKIHNATEEQKVKNAYKDLIGVANKDLLVVKGYDDVSTIKALEADIRRQHDSLKYLPKGTQLCVFLDGQSNIEAPGSNLRAQNVYKANKIRQIATSLNIPIVMTLEVPKLTHKWRLVKEDVSESVKYAFNAKVVFCLSPIDQATLEGDGDAIIVIKMDKNKDGRSGQTFYGYRRGGISSLWLANKEEYDGLHHRMAKFDIEWNKGQRK